MNRQTARAGIHVRYHPANINTTHAHCYSTTQKLFCHDPHGKSGLNSQIDVLVRRRNMQDTSPRTLLQNRFPGSDGRIYQHSDQNLVDCLSQRVSAVQFIAIAAMCAHNAWSKRGSVNATFPVFQWDILVSAQVIQQISLAVQVAFFEGSCNVGLHRNHWAWAFQVRTRLLYRVYVNSLLFAT